MMNINFAITALAALIPLVVGFLWYNQKTFGNAWMKASGVTPETGKGMNMGLVFALTYVFGFFIALTMNFVTIHQFGFQSSLQSEPGFGQPGSEISNYMTDFFSKYGHNFRTFKHGVLHGTMSGIMFALPILAINAMFERKGFKYIAINAGFWIVCMGLMGGVVCAFI
jgi:hypothetical protein